MMEEISLGPSSTRAEIKARRKVRAVRRITKGDVAAESSAAGGVPAAPTPELPRPLFPSGTILVPSFSSDTEQAGLPRPPAGTSESAQWKCTGYGVLVEGGTAAEEDSATAPCRVR